MRPHIEIRKLEAGGHRVVFLYPRKPEFAAATRAMKIRDLLSFGESPIRGKWKYLAWYADVHTFTPATYGKYAMLVRDFYAQDIQDIFNALFPGLDHKSIPATIHNPNQYMEANRPRVEALIEKYRLTKSPLEFYGSKHMAEGIVLLMDAIAHNELKGAILADEQGMAKTIQAVIAAIEAGKKRILVVAPKTPAIATWPVEINKVNDMAEIFMGDPRHITDGQSQWNILTWDDLRRLPGQAEIFAEQHQRNTKGHPDQDVAEAAARARKLVASYASQFDLLIADEFHRAKHNTSQRSTALSALADNIPDLIGLTGTPLTKRPKDIIHLLRLVKHPLSKKPKQFLTRYYVPRTSELGEKEQISPQRLNELNELLRDCCIRREKSQTNLPPKTRYVEKVKLSDKVLAEIDKKWDEYCELKKDDMAKANYPVSLVKSGKYREWTAIHKVAPVCEWADDLLEAGEKVVIFTNFENSWQTLMAHFGKQAVGIHGGTPTMERKAAQQRFQTDPAIRVFIGNVKAAGEGIDLYASAYLAFNDIAQLPSEMLQAEDRVCRGGQTRPVGIYFFLSNTDADEHGFTDFIESKDVVQAVTNRRDAEGNINDAEWKGDLSGTALDGRQSLIGAHNDFSWEDAGMEPPEEMARETDYKARARALRFKQAQQGDLLGHDIRRDWASHKPSPPIAAPDQDVARNLATLAPLLNGWPQQFAKDVSDKISRGSKLSEKQREWATKIIARNKWRLAKGKV